MDERERELKGRQGAERVGRGGEKVWKWINYNTSIEHLVVGRGGEGGGSAVTRSTRVHTLRHDRRDLHTGTVNTDLKLFNFTVGAASPLNWLLLIVIFTQRSISIHANRITAISFGDPQIRTAAAVVYAPCD